jgi:hypothetical protein
MSHNTDIENYAFRVDELMEEPPHLDASQFKKFKDKIGTDVGLFYVGKYPTESRWFNFFNRHTHQKEAKAIGELVSYSKLEYEKLRSIIINIAYDLSDGELRDILIDDAKIQPEEFEAVEKQRKAEEDRKFRELYNEVAPYVVAHSF